MKKEARMTNDKKAASKTGFVICVSSFFGHSSFVIRHSLVLLALLSNRADATDRQPTKVIINADNVLEINGKKVFHIGFDLPPLPDAKDLNGKNGIEELRAAGATFLQTGPGQPGWWTNQSALAPEQKWEDAVARHGMYCWVRLSEVPKPGDAPAEEKFRAAINRFKNQIGR